MKIYLNTWDFQCVYDKKQTSSWRIKRNNLMKLNFEENFPMIQKVNYIVKALLELNYAPFLFTFIEAY